MSDLPVSREVLNQISAAGYMVVPREPPDKALGIHDWMDVLRAEQLRQFWKQVVVPLDIAKP